MSSASTNSKCYIALTRATGAYGRPTPPIWTRSFASAECLLRGMSCAPPELGGHDAIDFSVFSPEKEVLFQGRLQLAQRHNSKNILKMEVLSSVEQFANQQSQLLGANGHTSSSVLAAQKSIWELHHCIKKFD
jgi:hypothetical protein